MKEFDNLLYRLQLIMKDKLYCEDNELRSKCMKYDIINLMLEYDKRFMDKLFKDLEYKGDELDE